MLREAVLLLLREEQLPVRDDIELPRFAGLDLGLVVGLVVQLGRETRSPSVVAASDRAVEDADVRHGPSLPAAPFSVRGR
jgi:hypothetical protein